MRLKRTLIKLLVAIFTISTCCAISGCGTTRAHWGVENEYVIGDPNYRPPKHKVKKPKKPKKHKKSKKHKDCRHHD